MDFREVIAALRALRDSTSRTPPPEPWELRIAPVIEGWAMVMLRRDVRPSLTGTVTGHPLFADGKDVCTSELVALNSRDGWAKTRSRYYRLGGEAGEESEADNGNS